VEGVVDDLHGAQPCGARQSTLRDELQSTTEFFKEPRKKAAEKKKTVAEAVAKATSAQPSTPAAQAPAPVPASAPTHG
jgi:hypothetical protein